MKEIEFIIRPDGRVDEHPLSGFKGNECHVETQDIEQALGVVEGTAPTGGEPQFRAPEIRQKRG